MLGIGFIFTNTYLKPIPPRVHNLMWVIQLNVIWFNRFSQKKKKHGSYDFGSMVHNLILYKIGFAMNLKFWTQILLQFYFVLIKNEKTNYVLTLLIIVLNWN